MIYVIGSGGLYAVNVGCQGRSWTARSSSKFTQENSSIAICCSLVYRKGCQTGAKHFNANFYDSGDFPF